MTIGDLINGNFNFNADYRILSTSNGYDIKTVYDTTKTDERIPQELYDKEIDYIDCVNGLIEIGYWEC